DVPDGVAWETRPRHVVTSRGIPTGLARRTLLVCHARSTRFADAERGVATAGPEVVAGANHADVQAAADGVTVVAGLGVVGGALDTFVVEAGGGVTGAGTEVVVGARDALVSCTDGSSGVVCLAGGVGVVHAGAWDAFAGGDVAEGSLAGAAVVGDAEV